MVSHRAESESWAVASGEDGKAGLREGAGKIICLVFLLKRGKGQAVANFEISRGSFFPY